MSDYLARLKAMPFSVRPLLLSLILFAATAPSMAQLPSLLPGKTLLPPAPSAPAKPVADSGVSKELLDAQARLRETQDAMSRLQAQLVNPGLAGSARNEVLKQFNLRQTLADRYGQQVDYLQRLELLDQKISAAKQERDSWAPPAGNPPWPLTEGDHVRNEMSAQQARIGQLNRELAALSDQLIGLGKEKSEDEIRLRQLQEKLGAADSTKITDADRQSLGSAQMALALKNAILLRTDLERRVKDGERVLLEVQHETAAKTWQYFADRFELSPELLSKVKGEIQYLVDRDRELELKALDQAKIAMARLARAQNVAQAVDQAKVTAARFAQVQAALAIAQANEAAARAEVDRFRQLIEMGGYALQVWDARAAIYGEPRPDAPRMAKIAERVRLGLLRADQVRDFLRQTLATKDQEAYDLRLASLAATDALQKEVVAARLKAANAQSDAARSVLATLDKFEQLLDLLQFELGLKEQRRTLPERFVAYWQELSSVARVVWQYELFAVDDLVIADGKEVKTTRSVTIGKSIGAIAILVFGFMLLSWLIRATIALAERRIGLKSSAATLIRRWLTVIATGTLIVLSFNLVQIPLSVFAFLGGALAIGVGFGTQNLLKNLISGVMLLVERPIRIGDLVEIDGVRGRVTSIGIRFSTIHSSDGIDTLIPNSELVEKKLTNWTFSNPDVRREVRVGVAYGADPVQVKNLMQAAALEHPDVMRHPEPMVVLDDLGDNALVFTLRYWIHVEAGTDGRRVDSDLRCEILEKLDSVGVSVPYPQRDVHLMASAPLPVILTQPENKSL